MIVDSSFQLLKVVRRRVVPSWLRDEGGAATIEAVLWFPLVIFVFSLAVDFAMVFHGQSQALRIIQDANRNVSIGRFGTPAEAETYVESRLAPLSSGAIAVSTISSGVITTTVTIPTRDLQIVGYFAGLNGVSLRVSAEHLIENWGS